MHQSSHRILRWTEDDRPFSKDFQDLFCTLIVAVELKTHRVRLQKRLHTFTTGEAVERLGNLRFTQSNRRPSPQDPTVHVTTKISTTFSMVPQMARFLCNKFVSARLIESCEGKTEFTIADSVWQLTPKGICILQSFAQRNGVQVAHVFSLLESPRNTMYLLVLEREAETDQVNKDRATIEVIFRRFAGLEGPNVRTSMSGSDSDSINDLPNGIAGVKLLREKKAGGKVTFTGRSAIDWLMDCCTLVDESEAHEIATCFVTHNFIKLLNEDRPASPESRFISAKGATYKITTEGEYAARWSCPSSGSDSKMNGPVRGPNTSRVTVILSTPSLRLLFREFLRDTHCEENLVFYLEVKDFLGKWESMLRRYSDAPPLDMIREILAGAYDLYNAFLAPGSPCELNIEHGLRNALVGRMTRFELPDTELLSTATDILHLYDQCQSSVFKLMASDSVPKFIRESKYAHAVHEYHVESSNTSPVSSTTSRLIRVAATAV